MLAIGSVHKRALKGTAAFVALVSAAGSAEAGGFGIREQSASLMGSAFAGAAAGVDLSSAFWNPAAFTIAPDGLSTQSAYNLIIPSSTLSNGSTSVKTPAGTFPFPVGGGTSTDIDKIGYPAATYGAYRLNEKAVLGLSINTPFGLSTDPSDKSWTGRYHGREADMISFNAAPTLAYEIAPGVTVAAGLQVEYLRLKLWFATPVPSDPSSSLKVDDLPGFGATAGILLRPAEGTKIGVGFRSSIEHNLEGKLYSVGGGLPVKATLNTPEMVTASLSQAVTSNIRVLGTVEWTHWSRVNNIPISPTPFAIDAHWDDGWFFSGGLEYDWSPKLTLKAGGAYEISPIQNPDQRLPQLPDSNRTWVTAGASYKWSQSTTFDLAYAHLFFEDAHITRGALSNPNLILNADVSQSADIISAGMRTRW